MTLQEYVDSLKDKRIAVIGLGVSNMPLIELLLQAGCHVTGCDKRTEAQMGGEAERLSALGAELKLGERYLDDLDQDVIIRTPGLMPFEAPLQKAVERGSVLTSEMEVFFKLCPCRIIAVTGSDGKTTTTTIISELLKAAGYHVHLGGNIGHPLLCEVPEIREDDIAVLELSSFQLHSMVCRPDVAVITNLTPNHLDKHKDFQDYIDAKRSILERQRPEDLLILNADDAHTPYYASFARAETHLFSDKQEVKNGAVKQDDSIYRVHNGEKREIMRCDEILIPGEHNVLNYMAAFAATDGLVSDEICRSVAMSFAGVEHRLETVRVLRGVTYINDSIASSPTRAIAGLHALKSKPIIILGGYDKHIPFDALGEELCRYAKRAVLTGATAEMIRQAIENAPSFVSGHLPIDMVPDFKEAVLTASHAAGEGDIVILSPACASFDRFPNFAQRGKTFKNIVMELE